jgi:hypothetical protein
LKSEEQYIELARVIYRDLKKGIGSIVDWRLSERYDVSVLEIARIVKASKGYLRTKNGFVEIAP